jgi:hypothetical protein
MYLLAFRQLALVMKHMLASTSKDNAKIKLGLLDEAYKDRVVPDAKYLSKRWRAGSCARKAAARAGAGGAHVWTNDYEWTTSSRVKSLSRTPRLLPDEQSADTLCDHGVARVLFSPSHVERPESNCNVTIRSQLQCHIFSLTAKTCAQVMIWPELLAFETNLPGLRIILVPTVVHVDAMQPEESRSWLTGKVRTLEAANDDLEEELGALQVEHAALIAHV